MSGSRLLSVGVGMLSAMSCLSGVGAAEAETYLFSYFVGNGEDGLHLAVSSDGLSWRAVGGGRSFLKPELGPDKLMRDPCILRGPDGQYHLVWTTGWWDRGIGIAHSQDLIHWSEQTRLPVMEHEPTARNCWAPEIVHDAATGQYLVFWATTIPGRFPETETTGDDGLNHRMYVTTTKDFRTWTPTRLFYDPGFNVIDATMVRDGDRVVLFVKDETRNPPRKNIRVAFADSAAGPFGEAGPAISPSWVEGPTAIRIGDAWTVYFDEYTRHRYGAVRSTDLRQWEPVGEALAFPEGVRHGTVLRVPASHAAALDAAP